jgi:hypothetical protein
MKAGLNASFEPSVTAGIRVNVAKAPPGAKTMSVSMGEGGIAQFDLWQKGDQVGVTDISVLLGIKVLPLNYTGPALPKTIGGSVDSPMSVCANIIGKPCKQ